MKRAAGRGAAWSELSSSGSKVVWLPGLAARYPAVAMLIDLERGGGHVLRRHVLVAQPEDADVPRRLIVRAGAHFEAELHVADHLVRVVGDAPRAEQRLEVRGMAGARARERVRGILTGRIGAAVRIDEQQQPSAAHHELVDGVERFRRELFRVHHHQHVDVLVDVIELGGEGAHREQLLDLAHDGPRIAHLAGRRIERPCMGSVLTRPMTGFFGVASS